MSLKMYVVPIVLAAVCVLAGTNSQATSSSKKGATTGKALIAQRCVACHALTVVDDRRATEAEWRNIVGRMVTFGAQVDEAEIKEIVRYLGTTHGVKPCQGKCT